MKKAKKMMSGGMAKKPKKMMGGGMSMDPRAAGGMQASMDPRMDPRMSSSPPSGIGSGTMGMKSVPEVEIEMGYGKPIAMAKGGAMKARGSGCAVRGTGFKRNG